MGIPCQELAPNRLGFPRVKSIETTTHVVSVRSPTLLAQNIFIRWFWTRSEMFVARVLGQPLRRVAVTSIFIECK